MGDNPTWSSGYNGEFGYFTFYDNYLYFPNGSTGQVLKVDSTGNKTVWATISYASGCVAKDGYLYVANASSGYISKILLSDPTTIIANWFNTGSGGASGPQGIVEYGGYLYASTYNRATILKISITDPAGSSNLNWATTSSACTALAVTSDYLYVGFNASNSQKVCRIKLSDATVNLSWATLPSGYPEGLLINNGYLYASNGATGIATGSIYKILLTDPTIITLWKTGLNIPLYGIGYNGGYIYAYSNGGQRIGQYYLPPPCFKEGSKILTAKGYVPIEDLRKGDYVRTFKNGFVPIDIIGKREVTHSAVEERIKDQLYQCSKEQFEELIEPLVITGCHCILVDEFVSEEQREKTIEVNGKIHSTDDKYRLPACVDERTTVYSVPGNYTIYHFALENENYYGNYGIYANGLLVESCSKRYLKELAVMDLIE